MRLMLNRKIMPQEWLIIIILVSTLGFPGQYVEIFGGGVGSIIEYGCFLLQLVLMLQYPNNSLSRIKKTYVPVYAFIVIIFTESMLVTNNMALEFISCFRLTVTICFGLWLSSRYSVRELMELICSAQVIITILSVLLYLIRPSLAIDKEIIEIAFCGIYSTKNTCGSEIACLIVIAIILIKDYHKKNNRIGRKYIVFIGVQVLLLVSTKAVGAILCALLCVIVVLFLSKKRMNYAWILIGVNIGFIFFALNVLPKISKLLAFVGKDITLTGRTNLWNQIISVMSSVNTWTGFGYGMFWRNEDAYKLIHAGFSEYSWMGNMTSGAHNFVFELWLNIGLIGLISFAMMLVFTIRKYKKIDDLSYLFLSGYFSFFIIHGLTERALDNAGYSTLILFVVIGIVCNNRKCVDENSEIIYED